MHYQWLGLLSTPTPLPPNSLPRFTITLDPGTTPFAKVSGSFIRPTPSTVAFGFMAPVTVTMGSAGRVRVTLDSLQEYGFYEIQA